MIEFKGFPAKMQFTPVPNIVFSSLIPQIADVTELKVLFYAFEILYPKKGNLKFFSVNELLKQTGLISSVKESPLEMVTSALDSLIKKGAIIRLTVNQAGATENIYLLNNETNRLNLDRIRSGEMVLPGLIPEKNVPVSLPETSDIFSLYEQNIGMLTPLIADELKEAGKQYPESWIKDAIKEAAASNKRHWKYIAWILEHWSTEGKDDGTHRGNFKKNTDPDKYIRGKYGHMVQR
jgi:DNA replication protein